jgi:hypothetical protein
MGAGPAERDELAATFRHPGVAGRAETTPIMFRQPVAAELAWGRITVTAGR